MCLAAEAKDLKSLYEIKILEVHKQIGNEDTYSKGPSECFCQIAKVKTFLWWYPGKTTILQNWNQPQKMQLLKKI